MINFVQKRQLFFTIAGVLVLLSAVALMVSFVMFGQFMRISIDFTGGSLFVLQFEQAVDGDAIRDVFVAEGYSAPIVQQLGAQDSHQWQVRTSFPESADVTHLVLEALEARVGPIDTNNSTVDTMEPSVGAEVTRTAVLAVLAAATAVLLFIWFSFRRIPNPFRYGVVSIVAMSINVIVTLGFYALMGILGGWEVDALFLTALLTVIGFSVEDVIVVFDRIRENIVRHYGEPFELVVNRSVLETLHRSLATQLNAMFVMIALLIFGGVTIKPFIAVMLVGMVSETFTSLCVAVPLLTWWEERQMSRRPGAALA